MDLHLGAPRTRGRASRPIAATAVKELTAEDLAMLSEERSTQAPPIKRLRERHHALARAIAGGMTDTEAALVTGYDISRVSILKADPTFRELLVFYRENVDAQYAQLHEVLSGLSVDAAEHLRERLEENPEDLTAAQLVEIVKMSADRTGHGPQSSSVNVNIHADLANRLEAARKRASARVIDVTPEEN